jgi:hypothetical protein
MMSVTRYFGLFLYCYNAQPKTSRDSISLYYIRIIYYIIYSVVPAAWDRTIIVFIRHCDTGIILGCVQDLSDYGWFECVKILFKYISRDDDLQRIMMFGKRLFGYCGHFSTKRVQGHFIQSDKNYISRTRKYCTVWWNIRLQNVDLYYFIQCIGIQKVIITYILKKT